MDNNFDNFDFSYQIAKSVLIKEVQCSQSTIDQNCVESNEEILSQQVPPLSSTNQFDSMGSEDVERFFEDIDKNAEVFPGKNSTKISYQVM